MMWAEAFQEAIYVLKEGTAGSYYLKEGSAYLPKRLSISQGEVSNVAKAGRNLQKVVGQLFGRFTRVEQSPLKKYPPYEVRTQIWERCDFPQFIGYGTIGASGANGKVSRETDNGDVVIVSKVGDGYKVLKLYIFPHSLFQLDAILCYLSNR